MPVQPRGVGSSEQLTGGGFVFLVVAARWVWFAAAAAVVHNGGLRAVVCVCCAGCFDRLFGRGKPERWCVVVVVVVCTDWAVGLKLIGCLVVCVIAIRASFAVIRLTFSFAVIEHFP